MSNASVDFPEPLTPVTTVSWCSGMRTSTFLRLCWRAPRISMASPADGVAADGFGTSGSKETRHYRRNQPALHPIPAEADDVGVSDTDRRADEEKVIAGHRAVLTRVDVASVPVPLWTVADLEERVDRGALLRGEAEPPYWAHLWTGARVLASYLARFVELRGRDVLDLGCGLGLTGIVAARGRGRVLCVDAAAPALQFVAASAEANAVACELRCDDFRALPPERRFDVILAAEVAYD